LARALLVNLEAYAEILTLLRPFFPNGWGMLPSGVAVGAASYLANEAALSLDYTDEPREALAAYGAGLLADLETADWRSVSTKLRNLSNNLWNQKRLGKARQVVLLFADLAILTDTDDQIFISRLWRFLDLSRFGQWADAEAMWLLLDSMGRPQNRAIYRPGDAECYYAWSLFLKGDLKVEHLAAAERLAIEGKNRLTMRFLHGLRGEWRIERGEWELAAESLHEAVHMARGAGTVDVVAETYLTVAKLHLGQLTDPRGEAQRLAEADHVDDLALAELWLAIGDRERAEKHAVAAYEWAWADGEPYVRRYDLDKSATLLKQLGAEITKLPPYDAAKDEKLPWEDKVVAAIEKLRAEKEAEANNKE
jgi:hypothetical protein